MITDLCYKIQRVLKFQKLKIKGILKRNRNTYRP